MRLLNFERRVIDAIANASAHSATLSKQLANATAVGRENSGGGLYVEIGLPEGSEPLADRLLERIDLP